MGGTPLEGSRYVVSESAGPGTFGPSFVSEDREIGNKLVLELLGFDPSSACVEAYRQEARVAALIAADRLARVLDVEQLGRGRVVVARERAAGERLDRVLAERGALSPVQALGILRQILPVLLVAHDRGVLHRALDASSVWVEIDDDVVGMASLADFGAATLLPPDKRPAAAPELVQGVAYDQRVDVYGLGRIAYAMLTGKAHALGDSCSKSSRIPTSLARAVDRCLWDDPSERTATMSDVERALSVAQQALSVVTPFDDLSSPSLSPDRAKLARQSFAELADDELDLRLDSVPRSPTLGLAKPVLRDHSFDDRATVLWETSPLVAQPSDDAPGRSPWPAVAVVASVAVAGAIWWVSSSGSEPDIVADAPPARVEAAAPDGPAPDSAAAAEADPGGSEAEPEPEPEPEAEPEPEPEPVLEAEPAPEPEATTGEAIDPDDLKEEAFNVAQLGTTAMRAGELNQAEKYFHMALEKNPRLAYAHDGLCALYLKSSRNADAVKHGSRATRISPNTALFRIHYGDALMRTGDAKAALAAYEAAKRLGSKHVAARIDRARSRL